MARTDDADSATAQFYINVVDNPMLDSQRRLCGRLLRLWPRDRWMDVVDMIRKVRVAKGPSQSKQPFEERGHQVGTPRQEGLIGDRIMRGCLLCVSLIIGLAASRSLSRPNRRGTGDQPGPARLDQTLGGLDGPATPSSPSDAAELLLVAGERGICGWPRSTWVGCGRVRRRQIYQISRWSHNSSGLGARLRTRLRWC